MSIWSLIAVAMGSAMGGVARALVWAHVPGLAQLSFPFSTLLANVVGSWFLGLLCGLGLHQAEGGAPGQAYFLLGIGFCGGFTTLSTFEWELFQLIRTGRAMAALAYLLATVAIGFVALWQGYRWGAFWGAGTS